MTTHVYWAEVEQEEPAATRVYWTELAQTNAPSIVYWAEVEATSEIGEAVTGSAEIPEITTVLLTGGASALKGATVDLTARVEDQDGDPIPNVPTSALTLDVDTGVATVTALAATDAAGETTVRATTVAGGSTDVTVSADGKTSLAQIVTTIEITTVVLTVTTPSLEVGTTGSASVAVKDHAGNPAPAGLTVTWASSNDTVVADPAAGVTNSAGVATVQLPALAAGTTSFSATCEGISSAAATITVFAVTTNPGYSVSGSAVVVVNCASVIKRAGRPQPRRFSDADQRRIDPTDTALSRVRDNQNKEVVWPNRELLRRSI